MKVVFFGDDHLAAVRAGTSQIDMPEDIDLSFWGAVGNRFRNISWKDEKIVPDDQPTADAFARFNEEKRQELDPALYDAVVFVGARIDPSGVVPDLLTHLVDKNLFLSRFYMQLVLAEHIFSHSAYQIAKAMAATGKTRVLMNFNSFATSGQAPAPQGYSLARQANQNDIGLLWELIREILAQDNITFIPQPLDTIVDGYFTDEKYGMPSGDGIRKNADYGARILQETLQAIQSDDRA